MSQAILKKSVVTVHHAKASIVNQLCNPTAGYRVPGLQGTILFFWAGQKKTPCCELAPDTLEYSRVQKMSNVMAPPELIW